MKELVIIAALLLLTFSCEKEKEPKYYHSRFYPVKKSESNWINNETFNSIPISLKLESRIDFDEAIYEGRFEPIKMNNTELSLDRDIIVSSVIIEKGSNLLDFDISEIELLKVERSGGYVNDSYILWINKSNNSSFYVDNSGYFTVYLNSITENNYQIQDSTLIKIE